MDNELHPKNSWVIITYTCANFNGTIDIKVQMSDLLQRN